MPFLLDSGRVPADREEKSRGDSRTRGQAPRWASRSAGDHESLRGSTKHSPGGDQFYLFIFFFLQKKTSSVGKTFFFFWVTWLLSIPPQVFLCTTSCSRASNLLTDDRKATRGPSCPSAGLTGVSACNYILTEVYSGKGQQQHMKACQTSNRALLTSRWYSHRHARGWSARPGMPSFDAGRDFVAQLNISWPFQLSSPPLPPLPLLPLGFTQSLYQQLCALIPSILLMPHRDFTDR